MAIGNQELKYFKGDYVSLNMLGAKQDGSTDDTAAIQAAMNSCAAKSTALMVPGGNPYLASGLRFPSGLILTGRPGARIIQKDNSATVAAPFITNSDTTGGNSDILIQGVTFDANSAHQSVSSVDNILLHNVSNIKFKDCAFKNAVRAHIYGKLLTGIDLEDCDFDNWGAGNIGAIYLASRNLDNFGGLGGAITGIKIRGGTIDGRTSHSSCLKIDADIANPIRNIQIGKVTAYPGDHPTDGTLGIELYSHIDSAGAYSQFEIDTCVVEGENNTNTKIFGISLGGSGGTGGSVVGCNLKDCRAFGVEIISSHVSVLGNSSIGCGEWSIDAGSANLTDVNLSHNHIIEPVKKGATRFGIHVIAHYTSGTGPFSIDGFSLTHNFISSSDSSFVNSLIVVENQTAGTIKSGHIDHNECVGGGTGSGSGISIGVPVGPTDGITLAHNKLRNLTFGINPGGTNGQYLFNEFDNVSARYTPFGPTDRVVEMDSSGYFSPQTVRIRGFSNAVLPSSGDIQIPLEDKALTNHDQGASNPNVWALQGVNFGSPVQGGIWSVNSRWMGNPNWAQTSSSSYTRAMFLVLGAKRFLVGFGPATSSLGAGPYDAVGLFVQEDDTGSGGAPAGVYTGSAYPLFIMQSGAAIYAGNGDPNGIPASAGSIWLRPDGGPGTCAYVNESGGAVWSPLGGNFWFSAAGGVRTNFHVGIGGDPDPASSFYVNGSVKFGNAEITGTLKVSDATLIPGRPITISSGRLLFSALVDVASGNNIAASGFTAGDYPRWTGTEFEPHALTESDIANLVADLNTLGSRITALEAAMPGKAAHGTYAVIGGGGGIVTI